MLEVAGLSVSYGDTLAVDRVSLQVARDETLALLGRSGSGKTTILRAIAGLVEAHSESINLDGRDISRLPAHRRGIGLVFQDFALFPHLDVAGNVAYGLTDADSGVVAKALEAVGLAGMGHRHIDELSGGQAQRVALARTLAPRPAALLLDEPFGSLDPHLRHTTAVEVRSLLRETGVPTIIVTHDTSEAFALGDTVAVLDSGRVAVAGKPAELWSDPQTVEAARMLGHRNIIGAEIAATVPWADLTRGIMGADGPAAAILIPETAIHLDRDGIEGTSLGSRFVGPQWLTSVRVAGVELDAVATQPVEEGSRVFVRFDLKAVRTLGA